ncbi:MAG: DUF1573 domain-containing protein [Planctomycetaceae bacterium]|jgi:hypothetical protein|nr:DUF1573 domain-containing protein [Planctomycetaceae bacterium]
MSRSFRIIFSFFIVFSIVFCLSGCNKNDKQVSTRVKKYTSPQGDSESNFDDAEDTVTLTHDFGVLVQPIKDAVTCEFEIKNDTKTTWNLKTIVNTCSCTIADMTSSKVEAGKTEKILVVYKPVGDGSFDDHRKSLVQFEEEAAPKFVLFVKSRVREAITFKPKSLSWVRVGENQIRKDNFEIQNFSDKKWDIPEITEKPEWLKVEYRNIQPPQTEPSMKQLWLAEVSVDTTGMNSGEHQGKIVLKFGENETKSLPIILQITSAVSAIPAQFFFGNVTKNEPATKNIKIVFSPDSIPKDKNEIHFEHNFGERLQLHWISTKGEIWELQALLKLNEEKIPDESVLVMTFSDPKLPKIQLPIYIMIVAEDRQ